MKRSYCLSLLLVAVPSVSFAAHTWRDELKPEARTHFDRGVQYYSSEQTTLAIEEFRAAYATDPNAKILYTLGQVYRKAGDCQHAIEVYTQFLESKPPAKEAALARDNIGRCQSVLRANARPEPSSDSSTAPPSPAPLEPAPATTSLAPLPVHHSPPTSAPLVTATQPLRVDEPWYRDTLGDVFLGLGVAASGAAVAGAWIERGYRMRASNTNSYDDYVANLRHANNARHIGIGAAAIGATSLIGAAIRFYAHAQPLSTGSQQVSSPTEHALTSFRVTF